MRKGLRIPAYTIASNAGVDAQDVVTRIMTEGGNIGYDAMKGEFVDMIKSGIIDPTKVSWSSCRLASLLAIRLDTGTLSIIIL